MLIATRYGILIYESTMLVGKDGTVHISLRYKISALPDEQVIDLCNVDGS
jgi:hypothetical protein